MRRASVIKTILIILAVLSASGAVVAAPIISDVLTCGREGVAGGLAPGTEMQRVDVDLNVFPDARCNDGTGAVFYFRPHTDVADQDRWVIQIQGGGSCHSGDACAKRWCMVDTNFSMKQMTSNVAPVSGIDGKGIMDGRPLNPLRSWNHVFIRYCSSDSWSGTSAGVDLQGDIPGEPGSPFDFQIHFLGSRILDATIDTLRRDGVAGLIHTQSGAPIGMPDLDDAAVVIFAGASAGGQGVIHNVDRIADYLRANNVNCAGESCSLKMIALIDSSFPPDLGQLDFSSSVPCANSGACDYESIVVSTNTAFAPLGDASCVAWHQTNAPGTEWQCDDRGHVVRHHVTTPVFIRMGQRDELQSVGFHEAGYEDPTLGPIDIDVFAELVRTQLAELANIQATAHEGASITTIPGIFSPTCPEHEVLRNNPQIFSAVIEADGVTYDMFQILGNWIQGADPSVAITAPGGVEFCPGIEIVPTLSETALAVFAAGFLTAGVVVVRRRKMASLDGPPV